jgi:acyl carrier protein
MGAFFMEDGQAKKTKTESEVLQLIAGTLGLPAGRLRADSGAHDLAEWDSMGVLSILAVLGGEGIRLDPGETMHLASVEGVLQTFRKAGRLV